MAQPSTDPDGSEAEASDGAAPPGDPTPLDLLLDVQDHDLAIDQLAYRRRELPERALVHELEARLAVERVRVTETREQRDKLADEQAQLDEQSDAVGSRIDAIEQRLRSGNAGSYRDEQAMGEEAASLARQRREIEDHELEVMEALEPLEEELTGLEQVVAETADELEHAREQLGIEQSVLDGEIDHVRSERDALALDLPHDLSVAYEKLRDKLGGIGAARLVGGACGGCHLQLPAGELNRLRHAEAGTVVYCDQCGRILVP